VEQELEWQPEHPDDAEEDALERVPWAAKTLKTLRVRAHRHFGHAGDFSSAAERTSTSKTSPHRAHSYS